MPISFDCPSCGRGYAVAESLAGKRVKCKDCGEPVTVPAAAVPAPPGPDVIAFDCPSCRRAYRVAPALAGKRVACKSCGDELKVPALTEDDGDLYGLADLPATPAAAPADDVLPPPRRPKWEPGKTSRSVGRPAHNDWVRAGMGIMGFGAFAVVLPFFGLTLGRGAAGLPPEATTGIGILCLVVGAIQAGIGVLRGNRGGASESTGRALGDLPIQHPVVISGIVLVALLVGIMVAVMRKDGGRPNGQINGVPIQGVPPGFDPGPPPGFPQGR